MMTGGIGVIALMWGAGSPMRAVEMPVGLRRLLTGILFAAGGTLVGLSPLGQRSGGHLNPAVTWAFWRKGKVKPADAILYSVAQCLGALGGVGVFALIGGTFAKSVQLALTLPGKGYSPAVAFVAEAVTTFLLMFLVLYCVGNSRIAARTPYFAVRLLRSWFSWKLRSLEPASIRQKASLPHSGRGFFNSNGFTGSHPSLEHWPRFQASASFFRTRTKEAAPSSFTLSITAAFFQTAATCQVGIAQRRRAGRPSIHVRTRRA